MISLYTLQRFVHFSPQDSIASAWFSHYMMFEKRMTETQSFRNNHSLLWMDRYTYFPLHLLVHLFKSSRNLINYARAHNTLWLHTEATWYETCPTFLNLGGISHLFLSNAEPPRDYRLADWSQQTFPPRWLINWYYRASEEILYI